MRTVLAAALLCLVLPCLSSCWRQVPDDCPNRVIATVKTIHYPFAPVLTRDGDHILLTHWKNTSLVLVIDAATLDVVDSFYLEHQPTGAAVTPDGRYTYVALFGTGKIAVLDNSAYRVVDTIPVSRGPSQVAVSADGRRVFVTHVYRPWLYVIDASSNLAMDSIQTGYDSWGLDLSPDGETLYVASGIHISVIRLSDDSVVGRIDDGLHRPMAVRVTPDGRYLYAANWTSSTVTCHRVSDRTLVAEIPVGKNPTGLAMLPDGRYLYCANHESESVTVIDIARNETVGAIAVGERPDYMCASPDGERVYVAVKYSSCLRVIGY